MKQIGEAVNGYINIRYDKFQPYPMLQEQEPIRVQEPVQVQYVKLLTRH
jgi:hypothetical protein